MKGQHHDVAARYGSMLKATRDFLPLYIVVMREKLEESTAARMIEIKP